MSAITRQEKVWAGNFGKRYISGNIFTPAELDRVYKAMYGITASELNITFMGRLNKDIRILEVGSNVGNQLLLLQKMGFKNLYGIDINSYAVELSKSRTKNINIIKGSAFDIPFKDNYFDLVFTAGLLIHINPKDIKKAIKEIYRCSRRYILGYEYYSREYKEITYRGKKDLMWKANFPKIYTRTFPDSKIVKVRFLKYLEDENIDVMFLLKKQ